VGAAFAELFLLLLFEDAGGSARKVEAIKFKKKVLSPIHKYFITIA
jgi:hypothetical protein